MNAINKRISIKKKTIGYIILLLPFFYNSFSDYISIYKSVNTVWKIINFAIIAFFYFFRNERKKTKVDILTMVMSSILLLSTIVNGGSIVKYTGYLISSLGVLMLFSVMTDAGTKKHSRLCFFEALFFILNLYIVCEVLSLLLFPAGMFGTSGIARVNFLGIDNVTTPFFLLYTAFTLSYFKFRGFKRKTKSVFYLIPVAFCVISIGSGTAYIGFAVFIVTVVFEKVKYSKKILVATGTSLAIFVFFYGGSIIPIVKYFVENIFGKDMSLSGRVVIWSAYILDIKDHLLLGHGITQTNQALIEIKEMWDFRLAHNELLQHLADGGIIYSLSFVWLTLHSISKRTENNKSNNYLVAGICSFIVVFTTETFSQNTYFFMILFLLLLNSFEKVEHS